MERVQVYIETSHFRLNEATMFFPQNSNNWLILLNFLPFVWFYLGLSDLVMKNILIIIYFGLKLYFVKKILFNLTFRIVKSLFLFYSLAMIYIPNSSYFHHYYSLSPLSHTEFLFYNKCAPTSIFYFSHLREIVIKLWVTTPLGVKRLFYRST